MSAAACPRPARCSDNGSRRPLQGTARRAAHSRSGAHWLTGSSYTLDSRRRNLLSTPSRRRGRRDGMSSLSEEIKATIRQSVRVGRRPRARPTAIGSCASVFPQPVYEELKDMPFPVADLGGVSGHARGAQSPTASISPATTSKTFESARAAAEAFQDAGDRRALRRGFRRPARRTPSSASNTRRTPTAFG